MKFAACVFVLAGLLSVHCQLLVSVSDAPGSSVKYTITNQGFAAVKILNYGTPFEGNGTLFFPVVSVSEFGGNSLAYQGALARRVPIERAVDAELIIPAKASLSKVIDIHELYHVNDAGVFSIAATIPHFNPTLQKDVQLGEPLSKYLQESKSEQQRGLGARANSYENCDSGEQSAVATAETTAQGLAYSGQDCMNRGTCNTLTTKWFGSSTTVNTGYYDYDYDTLNAVYSQLSSVGIHAYCNPVGCGPNVYAYVYPNDRTYTVYLCGAFWSQEDERPNTIVHEMSHFNSFGGTQDYVYGPAACQSLAKTNAYQASHNADNVCYFASDSSCGSSTCD